MNRIHPYLALALWLSGLAAAFVVLLELGGVALDGAAVPAVIFATLRLAAMAIVAYLFVTTLLSLGAQALRLRRLDHMAAAVTIKPVRNMTCRVAAIGLAGALALPAGTTMLALPASAETLAAPVLQNVTPQAPATPAPTTTTTTTVVPSTTTAPLTTTAPAQSAGTWTVQPGQSMWAAAELTLANAWGVEPTVEQVVPYWRELIKRNEERLVRNGDPNLILPDQTFELPPIPAR